MQNDKLLLLPCPFCGGEARISCDTEATRDSQGRLWAFTIVCDSCCATSGLCYSVDMATKSWNTRKPMERILEQLQECKFVTSIGNDIISRNKFIAYNGALNILRKEGGLGDAE